MIEGFQRIKIEDKYSFIHTIKEPISFRVWLGVVSQSHCRIQSPLWQYHIPQLIFSRCHLISDYSSNAHLSWSPTLAVWSSQCLGCLSGQSWRQSVQWTATGTRRFAAKTDWRVGFRSQHRPYKFLVFTKCQFIERRYCKKRKLDESTKSAHVHLRACIASCVLFSRRQL